MKKPSRKKSCWGRNRRKSKTRYSSETEARIAATTSGLHAYKCMFCDSWHIGHQSLK